MRIATIGECMIELSEGAPGQLRQSFGGDTLNAAVYLARLCPDARTDYMTALGDDAFSDAMIAAWHAEGIGTDTVVRLPGRLPGLYIIRTTEAGERSFYYWRSAAAARELFRAPEASATRTALPDYDALYWSGISVAILDPQSRDILLGLLREARRRGRRLVCDVNHRPRLWPSGAAGWRAMAPFLAHADLVFASREDAEGLFGAAPPAEHLARLRAAGPAEAVLTGGAGVALASTEADCAALAPAATIEPIDTTAAGDAFHAAYLAARLSGASLAQALAAGHALAGVVIGYRGAIIPRAAMPAALLAATRRTHRW
ncbi:MAG: sugar kinase [Alphaproteobacteria bacterium]|nr:sugar kinase [Alphaproteobacteria bacterium]